MPIIVQHATGMEYSRNDVASYESISREYSRKKKRSSDAIILQVRRRRFKEVVQVERELIEEFPPASKRLCAGREDTRAIGKP